jgi:hypothetical protein
LCPHRPSDHTARTKILDRSPCRSVQQLDRLCDCIANVTAWPYSRKPDLHLHICIEDAVVALRTNTHKPRSGTTTGYGRKWPSGEPCWAASCRSRYSTTGGSTMYHLQPSGPWFDVPTRHSSMNTLRPVCQGSRPRSWRDRMYSMQGTFSRQSSPRLRGEANQLRCSTLIPTMELDRACLPGLG